MAEIEDEHSPAVRAWARRASDVHAGLAIERVADLSERLRRVSTALQGRGDDLLASVVDDYQPVLADLSEVLTTVERSSHRQERSDQERAALSAAMRAHHPVVSDLRDEQLRRERQTRREVLARHLGPVGPPPPDSSRAAAEVPRQPAPPAGDD
jgi:hypothetical protein